eukprot:scaffold28641_cov31-Tisochrysis_lutea.AAC.1
MERERAAAGERREGGVGEGRVRRVITERRADRSPRPSQPPLTPPPCPLPPLLSPTPCFTQHGLFCDAFRLGRRPDAKRDTRGNALADGAGGLKPDSAGRGGAQRRT